MPVEHSPDNLGRVAPAFNTAVQQKLRVLRGSRTKARNKLMAEVDRARAHQSATASNRQQLSELVKLIECYASKVQEYDVLILNHPDLPEEEIDQDIDDCGEFSASALESAIYVRGLLEVASTQAPSNVASERAGGGILAASSGSSSSAASTAGVCAAAPPPPLLDVTPNVFNGEQRRYRLWRAQFSNWIDRRTTATGTDRLVALMKFLSGSPRDLIEKLALNDANYSVALELLDSNYGQVGIDTEQALTSLMDVPVVKLAYDVKGLRQLINHVQGSMLALKSLGIASEQYALTFLLAFRAAVPQNLLFDYNEDKRRTELLSAAVNNNNNTNVGDGRHEMSCAQATESISGLLEYLRRYTNHREQVASKEPPQHQRLHHQQQLQHHQPHQRQQRPPQPISRRGDASAARQWTSNHNKHPPRRNNPSTVAAGVQQRNRSWLYCLFCDDAAHSTSRCNSALTYQQRCQILDKLKRCHTCLGKGHTSGPPCQGPKSACRKCNNQGHYTSMHQDVSPPGSDGKQTAAAAITHIAAPIAHPRSLVLMASANIVYGDSRIPIRIFLDPGSTLTFITPNIISRIPDIRPLHKADLNTQAFSSALTVTSSRYRLLLASTHDDSSRVDVLAYAHDFGVDPSSDCPPNVLKAIRAFGNSHPLADRTLTGDFPDTAPALLLGIDQYYNIVLKGREREVTKTLMAKETRMGWVIGGPIETSSCRAEVSHIHAVCCAASLSKPARDVERLWSLEALGIQDPTTPSLSVDDDNAIRQFNDGVAYDGNSYTVPMPKRPTISMLANNKDVALNRLCAKRRSLLRDPPAFERYHSEVMAFVEEGHAEEISATDVAVPGSHDQSYYMPHHQVVTHSEGKEKWRIVFDCSSAAQGNSSLNSHLLAGPNLNPDLVKLLINFRLHKVAVSADITRAYMRINLAEDDRPLFRFLWQGPAEDKVRSFQMKKVTWGAAPSGFLLAATLREIFKRVDPSSTHRLGESLYHDDLLRSFSSDAEAVDFIKMLVPWLGSAGMSLAKWKTNSPAVVTHLRDAGISSATCCLTEGSFLKVLGLAWSPSEDHFRFQLAMLSADVGKLSRVTKRMILRIVASVFDPIGWLLPYTLRGKHLIQQLWAQTLRWDDPVVGPLLDNFIGWTAELKDLCDLRIPRLYGSDNNLVEAYHLHVFGDASETAYSSVAYLQTHYKGGGSSCSLLMAKSRLAPRDKTSMPRLELLAALLTSRLRSFLVERLLIKISRVCHYTDSTVAYYWCTSEQPSRWKTFVCNRVVEIQKQSAPGDWYYVPGSLNIADLATRGISAADLKNNKEWWSGPSWLALAEQHRPATQLRSRTVSDSPSIARELRATVAPIRQVSPLVDLQRYSSLESAVRVVANTLRFVYNSRRQPLPAEAELRRIAEERIIGWTQASHFAKELAAVKIGEQPSRTSKLAPFTLFIDEQGLLRAKTRLTKGPHFSYDESNPIVIPGESRLATLLILHHHRTNAHFGTSAVLAALRKRYWVTRARQVIKGHLRRCVVCRKSQGSAGSQVQAPLPLERVSMVVPFEATGLDFCGPFFTRSREGTLKNYVALFTCAAVRAVHLEIVPTMSTPQTHLALRRFLALQPGCTQLISDNARSFVKAATDLKKLFNSLKDPTTRELLAQRRVTWTFNCPRAPWHGGFFERLVGTVKLALAKTLGRSLVSLEELHTIICELSAVVNDRPLSYITGDPGEPPSITPSHFLRGGPPRAPLCSTTSLDQLGPNGRLVPESPNAEQLRMALLERTNYFRSLSARWHREYLLQLRSANLDRGGRQRLIQVGDVCLLRDDNLPRGKWNLVRITASFPGRDGNVRTYGVRFANGYESRRAAQLLFPLEVL